MQVETATWLHYLRTSFIRYTTCRYQYTPVTLDGKQQRHLYLCIGNWGVKIANKAHGIYWIKYLKAQISLRWRHNEHDGISNHRPRDCLLKRIFRRRSKKTSKLRGTGLCEGNSPWPVNSPQKGPITRKMFPFDDIIICKLFDIVMKVYFQRQFLCSLQHLSREINGGFVCGILGSMTRHTIVWKIKLIVWSDHWRCL